MKVLLPGLGLGLGVLLLLVILPNKVNSDECRDQFDDVDVDRLPCDNFFEHVCGNWYQGNTNHLDAHDVRSRWVAGLKGRLHRYFMKLEPTSGEEYKSYAQLANFYRSCFWNPFNNQNLKSYTDAMARSKANFPILGNNSGDFDWILANAELRRYGAQGMWRLLVQDNWQSADQKIFYILPPTFQLLGNDELSEFLHQRYLKTLLLDLGLRVRRASSMAGKLVDFERSLKSLLAVDLEKTLVLREPQSLEQWEQQLPELQLRRHFDILLAGLDWDPRTLLLVADMDYLQRLQRFLRSADTEILSTWLLLQLPIHFEKGARDPDSLTSQRDFWMEQLRKLMPGLLGRLQMQLLLGDDYQKIYNDSVIQVTSLFEDLKVQFELQLNETMVFDEDVITRDLARDKLRAMRLQMPQLQDQGQADEVRFLGTNCDEDLLQLSLNRTREEFRQVFGQEIPADPLIVNAYYRLRSNRIELPLGLMATPLVQQAHCHTRAEARRARFAAGLGYILAHEMVHAFDYDGFNYDSAGRLANGQWPPRAIIRFGIRAGCYLGSRYSNANARLAINENIADSEGLRLAFETYRRSNASSSADPEMRKVFFMAFAQNWCGTAGKTSSDLNPDQALSQHAEHADRVNNVVGNMEEFAEAFHCKAGSDMNPANKCRIW